MATYPRKTCSYLAADGPYRELCAELVGKYPNLQHEDYRHAALAPRGLGRRRSFRFVCIDLTTKTAQISSIATSVSDVKRCIQLHAQVVNARCLYILEGQTRTLTALIGDQLRVDPRVFLRQQKTGMYEAEQDGGNTPSLASTLQEVDHGYTFNIHEPRYFPDPPAGFHDANHYSADTGRYIRRPGQDGEFKKMGIITSNASFWSRPRAHEGWQALILVDSLPDAILQTLEGEVRYQKIKHVPYQGGYPDFIPYSNIKKAISTPSPPRTSIFDDLCHYFTHHSNILPPDKSPADIFLLKIIASQYILLTEYSLGLRNHLEWQLSRQRSLETVTVYRLERQWDDVRLFRSRINDYIFAIKSILRHLQASRSSSSKLSKWTSSFSDFRDILNRFDDLATGADNLMDSFSALSAIVSSRETLVEAETVGRLTILGTVFLPLSFVTGLFSMSENYLPGSEYFKVFWEVAVPLVMFVALVPFGLFGIRRWHRQRAEKAHFMQHRFWEPNNVVGVGKGRGL